MISLQETNTVMGMRGIEFTNAQFSLALMISIGMDKYEAYNLCIQADKKGKKEESEEKIKKDCDTLCNQNNVKQLILYLAEKYDRQVNEAAMNTENIEITPKMLKNLLGRIIKKASDNLDSSSFTDLIKTIDQYCKQFPMDNDDDESFSHHFILQYDSFNTICSECNREFSLPANVTSCCPHCGHKYVWDEENQKYIY